MHRKRALFLVMLSLGVAGCAGEAPPDFPVEGGLGTLTAATVSGTSRVTLAVPDFTQEATPTLRGYTKAGSDGAPVASAWFTVAGKDWPVVPRLEDGYVELSQAVTLPDGAHLVRLSARSAASNVTFEERVMTVDLTPPLVSILTPDNCTPVSDNPQVLSCSTLHDDPNVLVRFTVADIRPMTVLTHGVRSTWPSGIHTVEQQVEGLPRGWSSIILRATDALGNQRKVELRVFVRFLSLPYCGDLKLSSGEVCDEGDIVTETACPDGQTLCSRCSGDCTEKLHSLGIQVVGTGTGSISSAPAGLHCSAGPCTTLFSEGTSVTLTATPGATSTFTGWAGGGCGGTGNCVVAMTHAASVTASFAPAVPPAPSRWGSTGSMATTRTRHTATLLHDGRVLVAGGTDGASAFNSAELYDPASGTWRATGAMPGPRNIHTATRLLDGQVLVAGGNNRTSSIATAAVYDPASGTWRATAPMTAARDGHTATLLHDGSVLVSGGRRVTLALATVELYNPALGTWSATAPMATPRYNHKATLLNDGRVLVSGGTGSGGARATAEVYDPASGTWSTTVPMGASRYLHTSTLLPDGRVLVSGGQSGTVITAGAEVYDPTRGHWSATAFMYSPRINHTATLLENGLVLVAGGSGNAPVTAEVFDPSQGTWSATASMSPVRSAHTATLLDDGQVLVAGGGSSTPSRSATLYTH